MSGLASCCACFSLCSHTEWTGVCQSAASSSHSESPFSEPGALEEAEPDAGTETQTSDEGTHDPWPSHNRPHSHTRTPSWWWWWWCWRVVATATAAMETLPPPPLSFPPFIHTPPSLPSLLPISPSELIEKTLYKALFWLVERWAEQSLRDCWLTSSGSPPVRCLALIFNSSSFLSLSLWQRVKLWRRWRGSTTWVGRAASSPSRREPPYSSSSAHHMTGGRAGTTATTAWCLISTSWWRTGECTARDGLYTSKTQS